METKEKQVKVTDKDNNCNCKDKGKTCECHDKSKKHDKHHEEIKKLKEELDEKDKQINDLNDKIRYHQAELINYRKRKEEEVTNRLKYANQDLISELILILDNFERAIKLDDNNLTDELSKFLKGFKMMYASFDDVLKKYGLEEIEAEHKEYDPNTMEALMIDSDKNFKDGEVLEVLLKGYRLKDRVIRPASVRVNKLEEDNNKDNNEDKGEDINE
ncbi:MAG TPA: nucleotide exchange factor GrpE [Candidatus Onthousia faecipullorum]|uniref:Protein GrpE n=1 Tax=Candidatus Onthousia faecipullorum TaxID=2840887 RepID=A0A9D1KBM2_9FIRM|nr:nucleotide exchange factor GrpE [Candidatus Onthousia faecipullorum]